MSTDRTVRRPTIREVADAARVNRSTVSRVFNGTGGIGAETIERVLRIATELGYEPNPTAQALSTGRHRNIAVFVPDIANPFFPPLIAQLQNAAEQAGYCIFLGSSNEIVEREPLLITRLARQVDGMILVAPRMSEDDVRSLARRNTLVLVNRDIDGLPRVLIDSAVGTRQAVDHLLSLGHRHVAYVGGPAASWANRERRQAARDRARAGNAELICLETDAANFDAGRHVAVELLASGATAVLAFDDLIAQGILTALNERGVGVPDRISVVGCDDVLGAVTRPALTTVSNASEQAGSMALEMLLELFEQRAVDPERRAIPTRLVLRQTTARLFGATPDQPPVGASAPTAPAPR